MVRREVHPDINPVYLPQQVEYSGPQKPGTIVIDTRDTFLYLVQAGGTARRYGVGTGKPGPITKQLQELFFGLFSGKTADTHGWLE